MQKMRNWLSRAQSKSTQTSESTNTLVMLEFRGLPVAWTKRSRFRSISIRLKADQPIQVVSGVSAKWADVERFLIVKEKWLRKHLERFQEIKEKFPQKRLLAEEEFPFLGNKLELKYSVTPLKTPFFSRTDRELRLHLPVALYRGLDEQELERFFPQLHQFYLREAKEFLTERLIIWSEQMDLKPQKISFRNQKTRWGSCTSRGHISLNWKLIACPLFVIDAILVHELAHLKHMNHSNHFWTLVKQTYPDYKKADVWLSENQYSLNFLNPL